ncbi:MAG: AMP-binding protein [Chloroflexota bacterium]
MLKLDTRQSFTTLLDALTLTEADDRPAITYLATDEEPIVVTRRVFRETAERYAAALTATGIGPHDLVIIAHTQNLESIYLFWGCLLVGAIPSMFPTLTEKLDPDVYMGNMADLVRLSDVAAVLTTDEFASLLRPVVGCPVLGSRKLAAVELTETSKSERPSPDEVAFLQHSSGTTGLQKGVALSHEAVLNQVAAYSEAVALSETDVIVSWLPLYHDMGLIAGFLMPLIQGVHLVLMSPFDWVRHPSLLLHAIDRYQGTLCWLPNFAYNHCARRIRKRDSGGLSLSSMRLFINCSEPVRYDSHELFRERFADNGVREEMLGVSYAMAENVFAVTQTPPGMPARLDLIDNAVLQREAYAQTATPDDPAAQTRVSCGKPIPGTAVYVVDGEGNALPDRMVGELAIAGNCLLTGYYRRPDLDPFTADGRYRTGDLGYMVGDDVFVIGRTKDLIINAGKNVYPQDIEAIVNGVDGVHPGRAVVFGVPDEREGTELLAVVAEVTTEDIDERHRINRTIRKEVATQSAVTVTYVELVGPKWLLKTSSGKIARLANREKWLHESGRLSQSSEN